MRYRSAGKQVLERHGGGWAHYADCRDPDAAERIVAALNPLPDAPEIDVPDGKHSVRQEHDEYACKCGARWSISDGEEHP